MGSAIGSIRPHAAGISRGHLRWLVVLGAVALAVRVAYVLVVLPGYAPVSDAHHYHTMAQAIANGRGLSHIFPLGFEHPTAWRPPLYPLLLGGVYTLVGVRLGVAEALNVILGTAVVVLTALLAWRLAGPVAGVVAGILVAVFPPLVANDAPPLSEPLGLALLLLTLLLLLEQRTTWAGVTAGLLMLTRPSGQFFGVALAVWILWRVGWRKALGFAFAVTLVLLPWLGRNWVALGSPVLFTSNGFNLVAAYSPEAEVTDGFADPVLDPRFEHLRAGITNEVALDATFRRYGLQSLREQPLKVLKVAYRNTMKLFEFNVRINEIAERLDGRSLPLRRLTLPLVRALLGLGIISLLTLRRRPEAGPLLLAAGVFSLASILSVSAPRLRAPLDLACCIGLGVLVARVAAVPRLGLPAKP
jgi:4-amino-4-deoxy-L-arabinose transferase-like glycosyltransferase